MNKQILSTISSGAATNEESCSSSEEASTFSTENSGQAELTQYVQLNPKRSGVQKGFSYEKFEDVLSTLPIFTWRALCASRKLRTEHAQRNRESLPQRGSRSSMPSLTSDPDVFAQYSLLGFHRNLISNVEHNEEPIFVNTNTPWSAFICGSQGSGKSYTLSCILENCLYQSPRLGKLQTPLAGLVFHYNTNSGGGVDGGIAEVAQLCSLGIPVKVLVSKASLMSLSAAYMKIPGAKENLTVSTLMFRSRHLNIERMRTLMAFSDTSSVPLYMEVITMILRELAGNDSSQPIDFPRFEYLLEQRGFSKDQKGMLNLRLDLLKSFMDLSKFKGKAQEDVLQTDPGCLTIVDLTDPLIDAASACSLFDICLGIFLEGKQMGRVVALDEAHKYMTTSVASEHFTESLLQLIRQQRHLASRIIIATQEPTISPKLLDLCTFTIVHRFSSPSWLETLRKHVAGLSSTLANKGIQDESDSSTKHDDDDDDHHHHHHHYQNQEQTDNWSTETNEPHDAFQDPAVAAASASPANDSKNNNVNNNNNISGGNEIRTIVPRPQDVFAEIVRLEAGEALLFSPTALVDISGSSRLVRGDDDDNGVSEHVGSHVSGVSGVSGDGGAGGRGSGRGSGKSRYKSSATSDSVAKTKLLGAGVFRMRTRERLSSDGGRSRMAV